jgi:hypothetical protein
LVFFQKIHRTCKYHQGLNSESLFLKEITPDRNSEAKSGKGQKWVQNKGEKNNG